VYLVHTLNAHPVIQNQVSICMSLPWALKIFLGFTSDALPLCGERRRPYIFLGTLTWATTFLYLSYLGNPSGPTLGLCLCLSTVGMVLCDTISDAMIVERSTKECEEDHGHLQSLVYAVRFGAAVLGAVLGGLVYNEGWSFSLTFGQILCVAGVLPLVLLLPSLGFVKDMSRPRSPSVVVAAAGEGAVVSVVQEVEVGHPPVSQQLRQIWDTVTLRVVFQPMAFIFIYNLFQVPNVSWNSFLQLTLGFTPVMLGALSFGGRLMTFVGILIYKRYFLRSSWRAVYVFSTVLLALLSVLQLLLIFQINTYLGISNFLFSLGDDVMSAFITGMQFLPLTIVYMKLCPGGSEGATYSMLTTFSNLALILGNSVGSLFSLIWDVSNGAMRRGDLSGLWKLTVLTSCLSPLPLVLLFLLPSDREQEKEMRSRAGASKWAGMLFLVTLAGSLAWIIGQGVYVLCNQELNRG